MQRPCCPRHLGMCLMVSQLPIDNVAVVPILLCCNTVVFVLQKLQCLRVPQPLIPSLTLLQQTHLIPAIPPPAPLSCPPPSLPSPPPQPPLTLSPLLPSWLKPAPSNTLRRVAVLWVVVVVVTLAPYVLPSAPPMWQCLLVLSFPMVLVCCPHNKVALSVGSMSYP